MRDLIRMPDTLTRSEESLWRGVVDRNQNLDGRIFYAVRSTGVYCRPSCPSRRPKRRNVLFFPTPQAAENAGFRSCKRCLPRVHAEAAQGQAMAEELRVAAQIQRSLLPHRIQVPEGWDFAYSSTPCREVGGDYLDVFWSPERRKLVIALGDVSGKGVPAALLTTSLHAGLRAQLQAQPDLPRAAAALDRYLSESTPGNRFATLFCGLLDPCSGWLSYVNAGHPPALLAGMEGAVRRLRSNGLILGLLPGRPFSAQRVCLRAGDTLVLYSDGLTETSDQRDEELGIAGLERVVQTNRSKSAAAIGGCLEAMVEEHSCRQPLEDDRSWLVLQRTKGDLK